MLNEMVLRAILEKYELDYDKMTKSNDKVLTNGDYTNIEQILKYLIQDIKIKPEKIEKAPSILYFSDKYNIKKNYEFLIKQKIDIKKISNALTVLSTKHSMLVNNYVYIIENLDEKIIKESLSTLAIPNEDIVEITEKFKKYNMEDILIKYPITISNIKDSKNIGEIEKILTLPYFKNDKTRLTSSVFLRTAEEIEKIVSIPYFVKYPKKLKGTVFLRTPKEIEDILNIEYFKKNPNKLTSSVFHRTAEEIEEIINLPYFKEHPENLSPSVFAKRVEDIKAIVAIEEFSNKTRCTLGTAIHKNSDEITRINNLPYFKEHPERLTSTVYQRTAKEIEEILELEFFKQYPEKLTPCVFLKTAEEILKILNIPFFKNNPEKISGTVFHSNASELEQLLSLEYFKKNPNELRGNILKKKAKDIKKSIDYLENEIKLKKGIDLCKPSIFMYEQKHLEEVIEFLDSIDESLISVLSKSSMILALSLDEIKLRYKIIQDNNLPLVLNNGEFNSLFGMPRKRFFERYGVTFEELREIQSEDNEKKLIIKRKK